MLDAVSRLGLLVSRAFRRTAPDPFVIAILLAALTAILALAFGDFELADGETRVGAIIDAWRNDSTGFWRFLAFGMQMCLILITGHALAAAKPVKRLIDDVASLPRTTAEAAGLVSLVGCCAGLINWGLGLIVGALLAREVGAVMQRRGVRVHYPLIAAAGYSTMMLWHGGLSGSAPLSMTTVEGASAVLSRDALDRLLVAQGLEAGAAGGDLITLGGTLFSPMNVMITGGLLVLVPVMLMLLAPRCAEDMQSIERFPVAGYSRGSDDPVMTPRPLDSRLRGNDDERDNDARNHEARDDGPSLPDRLDHSWIIAGILGLALVIGIARFVAERGVGAIGLNQINMAIFALGLILHGSPRAYMDAATEAAKGCAGIIVQFPIYGGIMGMMAASGLVAALARFFVAIGNETTMPLLSFIAAGVVNLFVPSGGGQWAIQGPIALEAGIAAGVEPGKMIMAVAYGDQLTNMLQPFWALPLLAITGVKARDIVGYTTIVMVVGALWMALGLLMW